MTKLKVQFNNQQTYERVPENVCDGGGQLGLPDVLEPLVDVPLVVQDLDRLVHNEPEVQNAVRSAENNEE